MKTALYICIQSIYNNHIIIGIRSYVAIKANAHPRISQMRIAPQYIRVGD